MNLIEELRQLQLEWIQEELEHIVTHTPQYNKVIQKFTGKKIIQKKTRFLSDCVSRNAGTTRLFRTTDEDKKIKPLWESLTGLGDYRRTKYQHLRNVIKQKRLHRNHPDDKGVNTHMDGRSLTLVLNLMSVVNPAIEKVECELIERGSPPYRRKVGNKFLSIHSHRRRQ